MATDAKALKKELEKEFITIPEKDMYDYPFPTIRIGAGPLKDVPQSGSFDFVFEPGQTYVVFPQLAEEVRRIIKARQAHDVKLMTPGVDKKALSDLDKSPNRSKIVRYLDPLSGNLISTEPQKSNDTNPVDYTS